MTDAVLTEALFASRAAAGAALGRQLYMRATPPVLVLGITASGVEIASHAARAIAATFDVIVAAYVRLDRLGVVGAVAEDADAALDPQFQPRFGVMEALSEAIDRARRAIKTERLLYRGHRPIRSLEDAHVVLVDGPLTTPWKLLAAAQAMQGSRPVRIIATCPVITEASRDLIRARRLDLVCPHVVADPAGHPKPFAEFDDPSAERLRSIVVARDKA